MNRIEHDRLLLEAVLNQMPVGIVIADRAGRVVMTNRELDETPDGRRAAEGPLERALAGEAVAGELFGCSRDEGSTVVLDVSAAPVRDRSGAVIAGVAVLADVTDRERRERAEREFVTNAAHELQTPLTAITSGIEVLQGGAKEVPADRDRFLAHIQAETYRLARLVHGLLVLARVQAGAEPPRPEPVSLRPLLDEVALSIRPASGVVVRVRCPAGLGALADRALLEQAVGGIAANAAKYTEAGEIRLAARRLGDGRVAVEVSDTGRGLPAGEEEHVFRRFYRIEERARDGFGLGLAIARQAVGALGGEIELAPRRAGPGTVARIVVPPAERS